VVQGGVLRRALEHVLRLSRRNGHGDGVLGSDGNREPGELRGRGRQRHRRGRLHGLASPYGTFDQGGNVFEWNETIASFVPGLPGGNWSNNAGPLAASSPSATDPTSESVNLRVSCRESRSRAWDEPARDDRPRGLAARQKAPQAEPLISGALDRRSGRIRRSGVRNGVGLAEWD